MSLFRRRSAPLAPAPIDRPARVPDGIRVYAFGDLHGRLDLAERLRMAIVADAGSARTENIVVGLGDAVDRGPDPKGVVDLLLAGFPGCKLVCLRGNHEQMLLDFLEDPAHHGSVWFRNGAEATLASYGVALSSLMRANASASEYQAVRDHFARSLPPAHVLFLQRLPLSYDVGDYFFVHAGARPGVALAQQSAKDLLWNRFGDADPPFERVVVHGHTPVERPYFGQFRINLDTGAYSTNTLACAVFEESRVRVLQV